MRQAEILSALSDIRSWAAPGPSPSPDPLITQGGPAAIASALPVSDMATAAYGALAAAASHLAAQRTGQTLTPMVDRRLAGLALAGNEYLTISGTAPTTWDPITGYYQCGDGGYVYLHANFAHLRNGLLSLFKSGNSRSEMEPALSDWRATDAEQAAQAAGLCCIRVRTRPEWQAHEQYTALSAMAPISFSHLAETAKTPLRPAVNAQPLSGIRILDMSRVIAGPMAGRALAELGADVMRVSAPDLPHIEALVVDTGFNKRASHVDIRTPEGCAQLRDLIREADVLIDGFRPGALALKGFGVSDLQKLNPDLIYVTLSAFGDKGPWAGRRGYDSYVQAALGLTAPQNAGDKPVRLACQPLDYLTGCLSAYGALRALSHRAAGGGGCVVETSLARTGMWVWDMADRLGPEKAAPDRNPTEKELRAEGYIRFLDSSFGHIGSLAPPYGFAEQSVNWHSPPHPLGADQPIWASAT